MRCLRNTVVGAVVGVAALAAVAAPAAAHVHGFTPLSCLEADSSNAGAAIGFDRAADAAAPLSGPTPIIPLNASGKLPSGGNGAASACR